MHECLTQKKSMMYFVMVINQKIEPIDVRNS
jgi:hypothetical protein